MRAVLDPCFVGFYHTFCPQVLPESPRVGSGHCHISFLRPFLAVLTLRWVILLYFGSSYNVLGFWKETSLKDTDKNKISQTGEKKMLTRRSDEITEQGVLSHCSEAVLTLV